MTAGIVLAGGRSSRFGSDKLRAPMADGRPLLAHAVGGLLAMCPTVAVVIGRDEAVPDGLPDGLVIVRDPEEFGGPVVGLLAGLEALTPSAHDVVLVAGGDMPTLDRDVLQLLGDALRADPSAGCARLEVEPSDLAGTTAVMPCAVRSDPGRDAARAALAMGDRRLRGVLERLSTVVVPAAAWRGFDPDAATLRDVDLPTDLPLGPRAAGQDPRAQK